MNTKHYMIKIGFENKPTYYFVNFDESTLTYDEFFQILLIWSPQLSQNHLCQSEKPLHNSIEVQKLIHPEDLSFDSYYKKVKPETLNKLISLWKKDKIIQKYHQESLNDLINKIKNDI